MHDWTFKTFPAALEAGDLATVLRREVVAQTVCLRLAVKILHEAGAEKFVLLETAHEEVRVGDGVEHGQPRGLADLVRVVRELGALQKDGARLRELLHSLKSLVADARGALPDVDLLWWYAGCRLPCHPTNECIYVCPFTLACR